MQKKHLCEGAEQYRTNYLKVLAKKHGWTSDALTEYRDKPNSFWQSKYDKKQEAEYDDWN